jgi:hypothetical protein
VWRKCEKHKNVWWGNVKKTLCEEKRDEIMWGNLKK